VKSIHVIYTDLFLFSGFNRFMHFLSTYANSWIKIAARQNIIWIRFGNRRAVRRRRTEAGMALTAIGEFTQWGGIADCSGSRTFSHVGIFNPVRLPLQPTTPHWAICPMAVRAIPAPACHRRIARRLPNRIQMMFWRAALLYSTIGIDDIKCTKRLKPENRKDPYK